eukprot:4005118-Amphidinium_carterae.1
MHCSDSEVWRRVVSSHVVLCGKLKSGWTRTAQHLSQATKKVTVQDSFRLLIQRLAECVRLLSRDGTNSPSAKPPFSPQSSKNAETPIGLDPLLA